MGQGYSLTTLSAGSAGIDVPELSDLMYEKSLGTARFMKSIRARHRNGLVFVKVVMKPYSSMKLDRYVRAILRERKALAEVPNALSYERIIETGTNGYLVRQYLYSSLYDRMSTRPFLEDIEKKWLCFQLLCALRDCHARNVFHGDIKTENTLVTSWNWLYLSDFSSSFKPTFLPEDNPADFSYYFDTSGRRICYLAPERFLAAGEQLEKHEQVNSAMDIFSAGCVIAELFLESPIFSLSQLYKYRKGEYDPEHAHLSKIEDKDIRELVSHMIQVEPESRYSADEYLNFWRRKAFPEYFYSFLHQYLGLITDPASRRAASTIEASNHGEADDRIDRVYYDFDKISYFLDYDIEKTHKIIGTTTSALSTNLVPVYLDIPNNQHQPSAIGRRPADDGTLIFLTLISSSLRHTARATARIRACDILLAFAERITDEAKLDRVLPYVMALLKDDTADIVKVAAIRTLTQLMALVSVVSPVNAYVFPEYILPRLQPLMPQSNSKISPIVRATYASCLASLASTSTRFLDMVQALRADGSLPTADPEAEDGVATDLAYQTLFDVARTDLVDYFENHTKALLTDNDSSVRRAFLGSVSSLCVFFGSSKASDVILSHLNTYLNDTDWVLKCAFFETIVGVATFVGATSLEEFILPLMVQALTDPEEFVVVKVLRSCSHMAELGLFQRSKTWELVDIVGRFTMHPNIWIRESAAHFISSAATYLSPADNRCIVSPLLRPYLKTSVTGYEELELLDALKKPLSRAVFDMATSWATKVERGIFWKPAQQQRTFSFGSASESIPTFSAKELGGNAFSRVQRNEEDEQWITRLRNLGMAPDDELKLIALREYIWRMAPRKPKEGAGNSAAHLNSVITLKQLNVTPQTIFFDESRQVFEHGEPRANARALDTHKGASTITDALLDASMTIDDPLSRRKKSYINNRRSKESGRNSSLPSSIESPDPRRCPSQVPSPLSSSPGGTLDPQDSSAQASDAEKRRRSLNGPRIRLNGAAGGDDRKDLADDTKLFTHGHPVRHKSSAISLLSRRDSPNKAFAETSTTSTTAVGNVDGPFQRDSTQKMPHVMANEQQEPRDLSLRFRGAHTYDGNDPNVLKLLDSLYLENYPSDLLEFGPIVTPVTRRQPIKKSSGQAGDKPWHPEGILVAIFGEHGGPINRVAVAPDHAFFITGSDDGTVKIWDAARLERNVAHRSRQTHKHSVGAKVKAICFIENTHCFISAATDGSVHVVKVDYINGASATKYGKLRLLREYQLNEGEYAVWSEHFRAETHSVLLIATNHSRVLAMDIRAMDLLYTLENPVHHGTPTCFCVDKKHTWLLLGTSHGVLDLWDLRFKVRLKAWGLPGATPIHRLSIHPLKGRSKWVCVAGGSGHGELTVWDVEKVQCREVFRAGGAKETVKDYEPWKVDEEKPEGMLGRFATALEPNNGSVDRGIRAFVLGLDSHEDGRESRYGFLVTGGSDRKVRYWDLTRLEGSMVVSGLEAEEAKPSFTSSQPTPSLIINSERLPQPGPTAPNAAVGVKTQSNTAVKRGTGRPPRSTVISLQQQQLLKSHLDSVLDVAFLEVPYGMTITVDRSGIIYVFQ
ncbi:MAG: Serine/threonine-protein kinase [Pycnora praestabilis]|nr:MAG: Serine/threonine-protein kinase [Pycnora praestabilis]